MTKKLQISHLEMMSTIIREAFENSDATFMPKAAVNCALRNGPREKPEWKTKPILVVEHFFTDLTIAKAGHAILTFSPVDERNYDFAEIPTSKIADVFPSFLAILKRGLEAHFAEDDNQKELEPLYENLSEEASMSVENFNNFLNVFSDFLTKRTERVKAEEEAAKNLDLNQLYSDHPLYGVI